ncbi:MAG: hypothetical protein MK209_07915 [Planctomycetes bacterium]|nr:hypothetical protein [Planctomycetota bacterium]
MRRALLCFALACFCGYGYLASKEPGNPEFWGWFYGLGFLVCSAATIAALVYRRA